MKLLLIFAVFSSAAFAAKDSEITINVRGYEPVNYAQEIVKQEQLFRNIVVELEFSINEDNKLDEGKPVVQVSPARSLEVDPRL